MADFGYQYVNIDDCWMNAPRHADSLRVGPLRDKDGNILPNKHFPDMKALTEYVHAKGLKAGIYTSPGPFTCAGFAGTHQHEEQDARQFSEWGFDFLKYDWCSYGNVVKGKQDLAAMKKPYRQMGEILKRQRRDVVFNLCQYGMGDVWEWGAEVGGHCWRTAGDLGFELDRIFEVALKNAEHRAFSKPGSWNDPDYLQIGYIGDARTGGEPTPCPLTPSEQYSFMSLWCLMASPLFYSGDMARLDEFTLNVLCNPEVIEVDQDPLGQCARVVPLGEDTFAMVKDLEDGARAVGLFNRGEMPARVTAAWPALGLQGKLRIRDLWRQADLAGAEGSYQAEIPRHGCVLLRVTAARSADVLPPRRDLRDADFRRGHAEGLQFLAEGRLGLQVVAPDHHHPLGRQALHPELLLHQFRELGPRGDHGHESFVVAHCSSPFAAAQGFGLPTVCRGLPQDPAHPPSFVVARPAAVNRIARLPPTLLQGAARGGRNSSSPPATRLPLKKAAPPASTQAGPVLERSSPASTWVSENGRVRSWAWPLLPSRHCSAVATEAPPTVSPARPLPRQVTRTRLTRRALLNALMPSSWKCWTTRSWICTWSTWNRVMPV
jgi:hypothetical protein